MKMAVHDQDSAAVNHSAAQLRVNPMSRQVPPAVPRDSHLTLIITAIKEVC